LKAALFDGNETATINRTDALKVEAWGGGFFRAAFGTWNPEPLMKL